MRLLAALGIIAASAVMAQPSPLIIQGLDASNTTLFTRSEGLLKLKCDGTAVACSFANGTFTLTAPSTLASSIASNTVTIKAGSVRFGTTIYDLLQGTAATPIGAGNVYFYVTGAGALTAGKGAGITSAGTLTNISDGGDVTTPFWPIGSIPVAVCTVATSAYGSCTDKRITLASPLLCGGSVTTNCVPNADGNGILTSGDKSPVTIDPNLGITSPAVANRPYLRNFWKKAQSIIAGTTAQIRVGWFGDSLASQKPALLLAMMRPLYGGDSGRIGTDTSAGTQTSGDVIFHDGTSVAYDFTKSPNGVYWDVGVAGVATYLVSGSYFTSDTLKFYIITEPGAGSIKVQSVTSGGIVDEQTVNAASVSIGLQVVTITKTVGAYKAQVTGVSGRVKVLAMGVLNLGAAGVITMNVGQGGTSLGESLQCNTTIASAYFADLMPDLMFMEWKDFTTNWNSYLSQNLTLWNSAYGFTDWVNVGTTPDKTQDAGYVSNNAVMRIFSQANGLAYFDAYGPLKNYATMVAMGWMDPNDGVHPAAAAHQYNAWLMEHEFGFSHPLGYNAPAPVAATKVIGDELRAGGALVPYAGSVVPESNNGLDLRIEPNRAISMQDNSGNQIGYLGSSAVSAGTTLNWLPPFRTTVPGQTAVHGPWIIAANSGTVCISANGSTCDTSANANMELSTLLVDGKMFLAFQTPSASASACSTTQVAVDANYVYVCVSNGQWKRAALASW